jgi:copper chaperone CopZ
MFNNIFKLSGLTCSACQKISEMKIGEIPGVISVNVSVATGEAKVEAEREINPAEIRYSLKDTHYQLVE